MPIPPPRPAPRFKEDAQLAILTDTGFEVNLVEKSHYFFEEHLAMSCAEKSDVLSRIPSSAWLKSGNCILLAICRVAQNRDTDIEIVKMMEEIPTQDGARTYSECISKVAPDLEMRQVEYADIANYRKYFLHADGHALVPHCYGVICCDARGTVFPHDIFYVVEISALRSTLYESIDKTTIFAICLNTTESAPSSQSASCDVLLDLRTGARSESDKASDIGDGTDIDPDEFATPTTKFLDPLRIEVCEYK